jgi:hypothetical protein
MSDRSNADLYNDHTVRVALTRMDAGFPLVLSRIGSSIINPTVVNGSQSIIRDPIALQQSGCAVRTSRVLRLLARAWHCCWKTYSRLPPRYLGEYNSFLSPN